MFARDIGIDLGTANVLIHVKGKGIVLNQPTVVAMDRNTGKVLEVGEDAQRMVGRTPENIEATRPLKDGIIADFDATEAMLKYFIQKINVRSFLSRPRMLICCPTNITKVEQQAIKQAAEKAGGKKVFLEEEPKVAAIGAGMEIYEPYGNMIVDIGGGTTDIAVLSMGEIVTASSIKIAGNRLDQEILQYIKKEYQLLIGERTAENIKINVGTVFPATRTEVVDIRGRDRITGLPRTISVSSEEIEKALREPVQVIVQTARKVLERTPPELSADIIERGVTLTGGGALLHGVDQLLFEELKVPVMIADSPMDCVAAGTGMILENMDKRSKIVL